MCQLANIAQKLFVQNQLYSCNLKCAVFCYHFFSMLYWSSMFLLVFFVLLSYWYGFTPDTVIKLTGLNNMRCAVYPGYMMP